MVDFTLEKTSIDLIDAVVVPSGGSTWAGQDMRTAHGGILSIYIANGWPASGESFIVPMTVYVMLSHNSGETPVVTYVPGTNWFTFATLYGNTSNGKAISFPPIEIPDAAQHIGVITKFNYGASVTVTAKLSVVEKVVSE